jgi:hypothetical protein
LCDLRQTIFQCSENFECLLLRKVITKLDSPQTTKSALQPVRVSRFVLKLEVSTFFDRVFSCALPAERLLANPKIFGVNLDLF